MLECVFSVYYIHMRDEAQRLRQAPEATLGRRHNHAGMIDETAGRMGNTTWDGVGVVLSGLCLVHCLAVPLALSGLSLWGVAHLIHWGLAWMLVPVAILAAIPGYRVHRRPSVLVLFGLGLAAILAALFWESLLGPLVHTTMTMGGGVLLIGAHLLNWQYRRCRHREAGTATERSP